MNTERGIPRRWEALALLLITLLAAALRFYRLPELPPGLHFDEGFKAVTARSLLEGAPPRIFFESDMGEEPLAIYLVAASLALVGQEPWAVRLPSALVGTLTVPLAWWLGRELFGGRREGGHRLAGQVVGLGTALVLAVLYWHLSFSRIGMEPILVPFFASLAFAALAWGLNSGRAPAFALAGGALGGSLYTYKAGYFVPLLAAVFVVYAGLVERGFLRRHGRGLLLAALVALLVAAPIGLFLITHPQNALQRPTSVALTGGKGTEGGLPAALAGNLGPVLGLFFLRGDANPRSNLPGRPALDPFLALLFLIGVVRALAGYRRPLTFLPLVWLGVMVVPTLITEHAPHFGRAIGATPALALLCALGGWTLWQGAARLRWRWAPAVMAVLLLAGLGWAGVSTARAYFQTWGHSPDLFYAYDVGLVQVAGYVNSRPGDEEVYLTPTPAEHYTLAFLLDRPLSSFDGRQGALFPPPGQAATVIVLLQEDDVSLPVLQAARPDGHIAWVLDDGWGRPYAVAYYLPPSAAPAPAPEHRSEATFGGAARLLGYSLDVETVSPGEVVTLVLYWQALAPLERDYTVFTHLLGGYNPATDGPLWAGHDSQPNGGHYPTTAWQPGQVVLDRHPLLVPDEAPPGDYQLEVGLYELATMVRLPATDATGQRLPDDAALIGVLRVTE